MEENNLKDLLLEVYSLKTDLIREKSLQEKIKNLYTLRPGYQRQQLVGRKRVHEPDRGFQKFLYTLLGKKEDVAELRQELYDAAKNRYKTFSRILQDKEENYTKLKSRNSLHAKKLRETMENLKKGDKEEQAALEKEIRQNYITSAITAGKSVASHIYRKKQFLRAKMAVNRFADQKINGERFHFQLELKLKEQDEVLDELLDLFLDELTFLEKLFHIPVNTKRLRRHTFPVMRRTHLPMEKEDAKKYIKELNKLHREVLHLLKFLETNK